LHSQALQCEGAVSYSYYYTGTTNKLTWSFMIKLLVKFAGSSTTSDQLCLSPWKYYPMDLVATSPYQCNTTVLYQICDIYCIENTVYQNIGKILYTIVCMQRVPLMNAIQFSIWYHLTDCLNKLLHMRIKRYHVKMEKYVRLVTISDIAQIIAHIPNKVYVYY